MMFALRITDASAQLSSPAFHLIRFVLASAILIALFLGIRRALVFFLGVEGGTLSGRKYLLIAANVVLLALVALPRRHIESELMRFGEWLSRVLPYFEPGWLAGGVLGLYYTLIAFLLLLLFIQLVGVIYWFLEDCINAWQARVRSKENVPAEGVDFLAVKTLRLGNRILRASLLAVLFAFYVPRFFRSFPRTRVIADSVWNVFEAPVQSAMRAIINYLPNLGYIAVIVVLAWLFLKALKSFFDGIRAGALVFRSFPADWAEPTYILCRSLVLLFVLMVSYPYFPGAQSAFFRGFSVFAGALVTFGSSGAIGNLVAGIVLTYNGAFRVGDIVRIGDTFGEVTAKTSLSTRVRTPYNEEVTLAHTSVLAASVINYSMHAQSEGVALSVTAGIGYDVDWRTIHRLMINGARNTEDILAEPAPRVIENSFENYSVKYELRAWTNKPRQLVETYAALRRNVLDAFSEAGVEIMTPSILGHRDASNPAIPLDKFPHRGNPTGIVVNLQKTDRNEAERREKGARGGDTSAA